MFHLFDRVYLEFDHAISAYTNRIVISEEAAAPEPDNLPANMTRQIRFASHVSDLVGPDTEFATELELFKYCGELATTLNGPLVIFCDAAAMQRLFIAWHKVALNVSTSDSAWKAWCFLVDQQAYLSTITRSNEFVQYSNLSLDTWSREEFDTHFNSVSITKDNSWVASILTSLSIEYLLISYIVSPNNAVIKDVLKNKITLLAKRVLQGEIYDSKTELILNSQNKQLHDLLEITEVTTIDDLLNHPTLFVFKDPTLWSTGSKMSVSTFGETAFDISKVTSLNIDALIAGFKFVREDFQHQDPNYNFVNKIDWLQWIVNGMTDNTLAALLIDPTFSAVALVDTEDRVQINLLLLDWILTLHRTNNAQAAQELTISV
jgi:hypothetical protein